MAVPLNVEEMLVVGVNRHYDFCVGRVGARWVGFARGNDGTARVMFFLPGVSEGFELGVRERVDAILRVGAIAEDPESTYGGVTVWYVPVELRGKPDDYRCRTCGIVCCGGDCGFPDPDDDPADCPDGP